MKKNIIKKQKIANIILLIGMFSCIIIPKSSYASELQFDYTQEYKKWLELSEEDKLNTPIPNMVSVKNNTR